MASHPRRSLHRRPALHDADAATPAQVARQQVLARALPALAHYHPGKSWGGAYISNPVPISEQQWHTQALARQLQAVLIEEDEEAFE